MRDKGMTMKKLQHIIMIALILIGLATPALAQDQTDSFNVAANMRSLSKPLQEKCSMKRMLQLQMVLLQ